MMRTEQVTFVFERGAFPIRTAMDAIRGVLQKKGVPLVGFAVNGGKPISLSSAISRIERTDGKSFDLIGQGFDFDLGFLGSYSIDKFSIQSDSQSFISWDDWAAPLIGQSGFVMAWLADYEYNYWQNAEDPLQYQAFNKSYDHLPTRSNGLPYPLEQLIIDTSANPGRRRLHRGYFEAVGALMWLAPPFWKLTAADQRSVEEEPSFSVTHPVPNVTRLQSAPHCFTTAEGSSGLIQAKLRSMLFPKHMGDEGGSTGA